MGVRVIKAGGNARAFWELTKPGITRLVLITTAAGFYLASAGSVDLWLLIQTLLGTGLAAAGTNALNQYWEREADGRMRRTAGRPLPSGRLSERSALLFAAGISVLGIGYLWAAVGLLTAAVVWVSLSSYIFLYTPLKKRTEWSTLVGAVPGALPILAGWTAAGGELNPPAWTLFAILFLWQLPHFLALAWIYRDDYERGGFVTLSVLDSDGQRTGRQAFGYTLALVAVSLLPGMLGIVGWLYSLAALAFGVPFLIVTARMALRCNRVHAGRVFLTSVAYLPALLLFMVIDKAIF